MKTDTPKKHKKGRKNTTADHVTTAYGRMLLKRRDIVSRTPPLPPQMPARAELICFRSSAAVDMKHIATLDCNALIGECALATKIFTKKCFTQACAYGFTAGLLSLPPIAAS